MNFDAKISPIIAFIIIIAMASSVVIMTESFSTIIDREIDAILEVV